MEAKATNDAAEDQYAANEVRRSLDEEALIARQDELRVDAGNDAAAVQRANAQARAEQLVASAEGGGGGNTSIALLRDIGFDAGLQQVAIQQQQERDQDQVTRELNANNLNTSIDNKAVKTASPMGVGLSIAGSAASAYGASSSKSPT